MGSAMTYTLGKPLDLICIGRGMTDLYGEQFGGRLEDMQTFAAYVGGSAANICIGSARLGLKTAMLLRVGNDHMGRFIRETMERNGVDTRHVITDSDHPTPFCILGVRDNRTFPRDLFTHDCAYMALNDSDLDPDFLGSANAVLVNGTFYADEGLARTSRRALEMAREAGARLVFDIDYRPALWGLVSHGEGESSYVESADVSRRLQEEIGLFDLIVGTEEEFHILGASTDSLEALRTVRTRTDAVLILKRGRLGSVIFEGSIPPTIEDGLVVPTFEVPVLNTAGAGDAYMSGLMRGLMQGLSWQDSAAIGNACGAIVVSRHGCSDASPTWPEVSTFLDAGGIAEPARDQRLALLHHATTRRPRQQPRRLLDLGQNDRLTSLLSAHRSPEDASEIVTRLTRHALQSGTIDGVLGGDLLVAGDLAELTGSGTWIARPFPATLTGGTAFAEGVRAMAQMKSWPANHIAVVAPPVESPSAEATRSLLLAAAEACWTLGRECLFDMRAMTGADIEVLLDGWPVDAPRADWWALPEDDTRVVERLRALEPDDHVRVTRGILVPDPDGSDVGTGRIAVIPSDRLTAAVEQWLDGGLDDAALDAAIASTLTAD